MQIRCGCIWKQLIASIADSQRTISREPWAPIQKYPKSLRVPGAIPRQTRGPVPRSSAPTGRWAFPATKRKTALPRLSAYNLPDSNERLDERCRKTTASREILAYSAQQAIVGDGQPQPAGPFSSRGFPARNARGGFAAGQRAGRQVLLQPDHRRAEVDAGQVHHQVDRPAAALAACASS